MTTITQTIPSLGSPPLTTDPANFDTRADTLYGTSLPAVITATNTWSGQANTVAGEVNTNATNSATSATASATARTAAEAAQAAAQSASNATQWVSGQAYVAGNVVWSPSNYLSYRAVGATSGTTDPSQSASWVLLAVDVRRFTNPLAQAVSVQMTAAASGSNGISALNNANLNFGTGNFTLYWEGSLSAAALADSTSQRFVGKYQDVDNRYQFDYNPSTQLLSLILRKTAGTSVTASLSYSLSSIVAGTVYKWTCVATRETAASAGSVVFYRDGVVVGTVVISAGTPADIDNTGAFQVCGTTLAGAPPSRVASSTISARLFNRALTAAEVLDLSINGVALADRGASQTPLYTSDFSADVNGWSAISGFTLTGNETIGGEGGWLKATATATGVRGIRRTAGPSLTVDGRRKQVALKYYIPSSSFVSSFTVNNSASSSNVNRFLAQTVTYDAIKSISGTVIINTSTTGEYPVLWALSDLAIGDEIYIKEIEFKQVGLTSELIASNAQSNTGQIFDTSGNKNHALLPASGATVVGRPVSQTREVRWTNTWAGTNELQYIGGVNQAILPANAYIESIVGTVSGATPHDIIVGDGSDADRYVTITTGLAAGTTSFTLASRTTDGTNLKLTADPDTDCTMSIAWVIKYTTLES
jgi:hypothetical protein